MDIPKKKAGRKPTHLPGWTLADSKKGNYTRVERRHKLELVRPHGNGPVRAWVNELSGRNVFTQYFSNLPDAAAAAEKAWQEMELRAGENVTPPLPGWKSRNQHEHVGVAGDYTLRLFERVGCSGGPAWFGCVEDGHGLVCGPLGPFDTLEEADDELYWVVAEQCWIYPDGVAPERKKDEDFAAEDSAFDPAVHGDYQEWREAADEEARVAAAAYKEGLAQHKAALLQEWLIKTGRKPLG